MRSRLIAVAAVMCAVVATASCGSDEPTEDGAGSGTKSSGESLSGTSWTLTSYAGSDQKQTGAAPGGTAALAFGADGAVAGSTGCNQFAGTYTVDGDKLTINLGPMTLAGCAGPLLDAQQSAITQQLPLVAGYSVVGDALTLTNADGDALLTYSAASTTLEGTAWTVTGVNNGNGAVESTVLTEALTAEFNADLTFSGSGGCNQLSGMYATSGGDGLAITGLASTRMSCGPDVGTLESQYIAALGNVSTYQITGDTLTLRDSTGATQVTARVAASTG